MNEGMILRTVPFPERGSWLLAWPVHMEGADDVDLVAAVASAGESEFFGGGFGAVADPVRLAFVAGADLHDRDLVPGGGVVNVDRTANVDFDGFVFGSEDFSGGTQGAGGDRISSSASLTTCVRWRLSRTWNGWS